ncbi:TPA: hypothetical protein ACGO92_001978, partial [Streptococcus suis]
MIKKCQESKGYGSIRKGIHGAVGVLALGLLFSTTAVVYADEVSDNTPTTASSEQVINASEAVELTADNDVAISTRNVGNEATPVVETATSTTSTSLSIEDITSTNAEASNSAVESISTTPDSNMDLAVNISPASDGAAEVLEDRTAPKLVSYILGKTEYQSGETVTL